jgi:hypothetical protein
VTAVPASSSSLPQISWNQARRVVGAADVTFLGLLVHRLRHVAGYSNANFDWPYLSRYFAVAVRRLHSWFEARRNRRGVPSFVHIPAVLVLWAPGIRLTCYYRGVITRRSGGSAACAVGEPTSTTSASDGFSVFQNIQRYLSVSFHRF